MLRLIAAGDSMITRRLSPSRDRAFLDLVNLIRSADAAFTNFEMGCPRDPLMPNVNHPSAFQYSKPFVLDELKWCGFNLIGAGNNHIGDYGPKGLMDTLEEIEARGLVTAGAGASLGEARAPGYLDTAGGRLALLAASSTNVEHGMALARRSDMDGRPGVNPLRFEVSYYLDEARYRALVDIDQALGTAATTRHRQEFSALHGRSNPDALSFLGANFFRGDTCRVSTRPRAADLDALLRGIAAARRQADLVVVSLHAHEGPANDLNSDTPADFIVEAARRAIEAGADAVLGTGPHMLRRIEIHQGKPIFLSLGSFVFQIETVQRQPAAAYEKHGLGPDCLPPDVTDAVGAVREGPPRGFWDRRMWTSVVADCRFEEGRLRSLELHPIDLGMELPRHVRGAPVLASAERGEEVLQGLAALCRESGVEITTERAGDRVVGRLRL